MNNFKYASTLVFLSTSVFHIQHGKNNCLPKIKLNWCFKYWSIFVLNISSFICAVMSVYFFSALKFSENKKIASTERWLCLKQCTKIEWKTLSNHINKNIYIFNWIFTYFTASLTQIHRMTLRAKKKNSHLFFSTANNKAIIWTVQWKFIGFYLSWMISELLYNVQLLTFI